MSLMRSIAPALLLVTLGCKREPPAEETAIAPPETTAPAAPAGPRAEAEGFVLESVAPTGAQVGSAAALQIKLQTRGGWHVNMEFPPSIELQAPATLGLAKTSLARADAAEYDETHFRFDAPITPTGAGASEVRASVNFAICTDENCLPQSVELAFPVRVQ